MPPWGGAVFQVVDGGWAGGHPAEIGKIIATVANEFPTPIAHGSPPQIRVRHRFGGPTIDYNRDRAVDKAGVVGSVVSAAACPACFPALASLDAAMGLGVFAEYEPLIMTRLLPPFAALALFANALGWLRHRQWHRSVLGMIGPAIVLAALLLFPGEEWFDKLLYTGLVCMVGVSLWDLLSPTNKRCAVSGRATPQARQ